MAQQRPSVYDMILSGQLGIKNQDPQAFQEKLAKDANKNELLNTGLGAAGTLAGTYLAKQLAATAATQGASALTAPTILSAGTAGATAGTAGAAGAGAGAGAAGTGLASSLASVAAPVAAIAVGGYGAYKGINATKDIASGEGARSRDIWQAGLFSPALIPTLFGVNPVSKLFGSGKSKSQQFRDSWRKAGQQSGFIDKDWNVGLAGGNKFNVGRDGQNRLANQDGGERFMYETDATNKATAEDIGRVDPLAEILAAKYNKNASPEDQEKARSQQAAYLTNAIQSQGDAVANAKQLYANAGLDRETAYQDVLDLIKSGKIDQARGNAYLASIDKLFG